MNRILRLSYCQNLKIMWKVFSYEDVHYMIKLKLSDDLCVYLTDLKYIWKEVVSKERAFTRFQEVNSTFEVNLETALDQILLLSSDIGADTQLNICKCETQIEVSIKGNALEFPVKYKFYCDLQDSETYFKEVTVPLILTIKEQENKAELLSILLQKKDREIEEHIMENGEISRKSLITEKFKKDEHFNEENSFAKVFDNSPTFWKSFLTRHDPQNQFISVNQTHNPPKKIKLKVYSSETTKKNKDLQYTSNKSK